MAGIKLSVPGSSAQNVLAPVFTASQSSGETRAERVHLLSRVMNAAEGRRIVLIVDEVGFDHRLVIESVSETCGGSAEQCEANR